MSIRNNPGVNRGYDSLDMSEKTGSENAKRPDETDFTEAENTFDKKRFMHDIQLRMVKLLNILLVTGVFAVAWYGYYAERIRMPFYCRGNWLIVFIFFLIYLLLGITYDSFMISYYRISEMIYSQMLSILGSDLILYIICLLLSRKLPTVWPLLLTFVAQAGITVLWSYRSHKWYFRHFQAKKTFIVWDMRKGMTDLIQSYGLEKKFDIRGNCSAEECVKNLSVLNGMNTVFLTGVHSHDRNVIIKYCVEKNITVFVIPRIGDVMMSGAKKMHLFHLPMLRLTRYSPPLEFLFLKRLFDIVLSLVAIIVTSPLMLVIAILIKREDGGPVLYRQVRLTKNGRKFAMLKFRSMRVDAEKDGKARLSTGENDERVTRIGRRIRRVRLDELPQFINILRGDMSFVGPRPERPEIAREYEKELPEFRLRLQAKCGLTGYAQVYGKYNTTPYDKLQMDLMYIANPSIGQDIMILFATIKILFLKDSTEGVAEGQTTASFHKPEDSVKEEVDTKTQHVVEKAEQNHNI